jgi:hypothetical protein
MYQLRTSDLPPAYFVILRAGGCGQLTHGRSDAGYRDVHCGVPVHGHHGGCGQRFPWCCPRSAGDYTLRDPRGAPARGAVLSATQANERQPSRVITCTWHHPIHADHWDVSVLGQVAPNCRCLYPRGSERVRLRTFYCVHCLVQSHVIVDSVGGQYTPVNRSLLLGVWA